MGQGLKYVVIIRLYLKCRRAGWRDAWTSTYVDMYIKESVRYLSRQPRGNTRDKLLTRYFTFKIRMKTLWFRIFGL
jgi:hypothetical protein